MTDYKKMIKDLLFFKECERSEKFILKESKEESKQSNKEHSDKKSDANDDKESKSSENKPKMFKKLFKSNATENINENDDSKKTKGEDKKKELGISKKISENLEFIKKIYNVPINSDTIIREFDIIVKNKAIKAFIVFIDGMVDRKVINDNILQPLMLLSNLDIKGDENEVGEYIKRHLLPHHQLKIVSDYKKVIDEVNFGGCGVFVDGINEAFAADVKGWEHRTIERPNTELVIRGPQEGFGEILRVNTALVRKYIKDENLIIETLPVGKRSQTTVSILYIKDISNESLVDEVRRRVNSIKVDYIIDSGELEQYIEDSTLIPAPQIIATERPDRVASALSEGKVAIIMNGSPFALTLPTTAHELIHSPEDSYIRFPYANFIRCVRILGLVLSLLLPGLYVAITNFHQEMIPTDLLLAIEASREKVPFPTVVEIIIMEMSFELIREAGIRIPGPIGPTLGIIGALILGQAAVAANIVSPILIIIVALTGIGSFSVPNFSLGIAFRVLRFAFIALGAIAGFLGIAAGLFLQGLWFAKAKSFGVPFLAPFGPKTKGTMKDTIFKSPIWQQEERPDYLNTKKTKKQPHISRGWIKSQKKDDKNEQ